MSDNDGSDSVEYSEKQEALIAQLTVPRTAEELVEEVYDGEAQTGAVRGLISRINREHDDRVVDFDPEGFYFWAGAEEVLHQISSEAKQTKTRRVNKYRAEKEREIKQVLQATEPAVAPQYPTLEGEDIVFFLTDLHYGDLIKDPATGEVLYDFDEADRCVEEIVQQGMEHYRRAQSHTTVNTAHLCINGDICTGEVVYDTQWVHIEDTLDVQTERARDKLWWVIETLAAEFETLQVVVQPGNHGQHRNSSSSGQANTDVQLYGTLDALARYSDYDNINFVRNTENSNYVNFHVRDGAVKGHMRHGQNCMAHVDATASSSRDWRGWLNIHEFDFALKGHIHQLQQEMVMDKPVITGGSPKPPGDFAERIAQWGAPSAVVFGISDTRVPSWTRPIYFD